MNNLTKKRAQNNRWLWPSLLFLLCIGILATCFFMARAERNLREEFLRKTRLVAKAMNVDQLRELTGTEADLDTPAYLRIKEHFAAIKDIDKHIRFIYLVGRNPDGQVFFFVDNEPVGSRDEATAGMIYDEVPSGFLRAFDENRAITVGPIVDRWGRWITSLVPLKDPLSGEQLAIFGMDVDAKHWRWNIFAHIAMPLGLFLSLLIVLAVVLIVSLGRHEVSAKPVLQRLLIPLTIFLLLTSGGFCLVLVNLQWKQLIRTSEEKLTTTVSELTERLELQIQELAALEVGILADSKLHTALENSNRDQLLTDFMPVYEIFHENFGITHFYFHRPDRVNLLRLHKPEKYGDLIDRFTAQEAECTGKMAAGIELGPLGTLTLRVVRPVFNGTNLIGYLELGKEIEDVLTHLHDENDIELAVSIHKNTLTQTDWEAGMNMLGRNAEWNRFPHNVLIYSSLNPFPSACNHYISEEHHKHETSISDLKFGGKRWQVLNYPLKDVAGADVGDLLLLLDISGHRALLKRFFSITVPIGILVLTVLLGTLYIILRRADISILAQQAALRESNELFDQLAKQSKTIVWEVDANCVYTHISDVAEQVFGYRTEEIVGRMHFYDLHPAEGREAFKAKIFEIFNKKKAFRDLENIIETKTGEIIWMSTNGIPILDDEGRLMGYRGSDTDITDRKKQEQEIQKLSQVVKNTKSSVVIADLEGHIIYVNQALVETGGFDNENELIGKSIFSFCETTSLQKLQQVILPTLLEKGRYQGELFFKRKNNSIFPADINCSTILDKKEQAEYLVAIFTDTTERKHAEEAERKALDMTTRLNNLMSGREDRVLELKAEVNALLSELGRKLKYRGKQ